MRFRRFLPYALALAMAGYAQEPRISCSENHCLRAGRTYFDTDRDGKVDQVVQKSKGYFVELAHFHKTHGAGKCDLRVIPDNSDEARRLQEEFEAAKRDATIKYTNGMKLSCGLNKSRILCSDGRDAVIYKQYLSGEDGKVSFVALRKRGTNEALLYYLIFDTSERKMNPDLSPLIDDILSAGGGRVVSIERGSNLANKLQKEYEEIRKMLDFYPRPLVK